MEEYDPRDCEYEETGLNPPQQGCPRCPSRGQCCRTHQRVHCGCGEVEIGMEDTQAFSQLDAFNQTGETLTETAEEIQEIFVEIYPGEAPYPSINQIERWLQD